MSREGRIYRDRLNIDIEQVRGEIEERIAHLGEDTDLLAGSIPAGSSTPS